MRTHAERETVLLNKWLSVRMVKMKSKVQNMTRILSGLVLALVLLGGVTRAQQPSPSPRKSPEAKADAKPDAKTQDSTPQATDEMGDYTVISSLEFGYRGLRVDGDLNKYQSDRNYKAGPRVFDSSFLLQSKEGKGGPFETFLVTSTGWGGDPYGHMRISVEKAKWYRFDGTYRRFKYFRFLNNLANPNFATQPPNPVTGEHGYDTRQELGDFDLTLLPKNKIRFILGYSPERYSGPAFTTYHVGGDDFMLLSQLRSRANDFRFGADGKVGPIDFSFLQGFRHFRDDSFIPNAGQNLGANPALSNALLTSFTRNEPARGSVDYTRLSLHTLLAKKLDITGRLVYSSATGNFVFAEAFTGVNWNARVTTVPSNAPPNTLNLGQYNLAGNTKRPNTLGDFGVTYMVTEKFRISNTFRVETFQINGGDTYNAAFFFTKTPQPAPIITGNFSVYKVTKYRKIQDTIEGDYQFNTRYSMHIGYRYGARRIEQILSGFGLNANVPAAVVPEDEVQDNHTNVVFGGFKARPVKNWTIYFDAEHGTADNVFTRVGNYDYTNFRAKTRYTPNHKLSFSLAVITRDNSNPSEIGGVSLADFGVNIKSRVFTSAVDWAPTSKLSFSTGYNHNWVNSDAVINYFFLGVNFPTGHSQYFMRNHFFYFDATTQLHPRVTLYAAYRINKDNGQGNRLAAPTAGLLITSYPMSYQSPEGRLAIKINRRLDWNIGYQYYNYNESLLVGPRPQNYHAHLPYTSLRIYFGQRG
jgi:hypothetical protein